MEFYWWIIIAIVIIVIVILGIIIKQKCVASKLSESNKESNKEQLIKKQGEMKIIRDDQKINSLNNNPFNQSLQKQVLENPPYVQVEPPKIQNNRNAGKEQQNQYKFQYQNNQPQDDYTKIPSNNPQNVNYEKNENQVIVQQEKQNQKEISNLSKNQENKQDQKPQYTNIQENNTKKYIQDHIAIQNNNQIDEKQQNSFQPLIQQSNEDVELKNNQDNELISQKQNIKNENQYNLLNYEQQRSQNKDFEQDQVIQNNLEQQQKNNKVNGQQINQNNNSFKFFSNSTFKNKLIFDCIIGDVKSVSQNKNNNQDEKIKKSNQNQEQVVIDNKGLLLLQNIIDETSQKRQIADEFKPYIRQLQEKSDLKRNYGLTLIASSKLYQYCNAFREVRGDGNCFYTAFGYQFLCILLFEYTFDQFQEFIDKIRKSDLPMKIFVTDKDLKIDDKQLEKQLLEEFLNRLTKLKQIDDITQRQDSFNTQFAAYEKQSEEIDGYLYGLSTIFFRNYSNQIVDLSINKDAVFDREKLLKWEEECNSNEVVIAELAKQLNVFVQLIFFQDKDNFVVNEYEKDKQHKIILLIKPGHYNIGYFKPESENKNNNQDEQIKKSNQNQEQVVIEIHKSDNNEIDGQTIQQSIIGDVESVSENKNNNQDEQSNPRNQNQEQVVIDIPQQVINQPNSKIDGLSLLQNIINETSQQRQVLDEYKYYIRRFQDKSDLKKNYGLTLKASSKLYQYCNAFREVRGDGNCFYTAFGYQFLCILLFEYTFDQFQEFIDKIRKSDLPMKIFVTDKDLKIDDKYLEKQLLEEFLNRLTKLKQIDDITQRQEQFNTQFAAYEKQSEEIDGCLYGLSTIFFRNYSNYIVELSINKDAVFDREKLLKWEEECNSNEVVIAELAKQLNVFVQLIFFKDLDNFVVNEYEKDKQHKIILLIKPGHYNIGYFKPESENKNNNQDEQIKKSNQNQEQVVIEIHKSDNNEIDGQTIQQSIIGDVESVSENKNNNQDEQSNPRNQNQEQVVIDIPQQVINQPNSKIDGLSLLQNIINETSQQRQVLDEYKYYIRRFQDKSDLKKNYGLTLKASSKLYQYCNAFREVRGDGNCFYTAFGYQFLCILLFEYTFDQFQEFIDKIRKSDLPMKIFVTDKDLKIDDKQLEKQLLEEFLNRLTKLKQIDDITQRQDSFNTQFAAYEKQSEEIDGYLYGLSTIFFRNYSNQIVDLSINKDAVFDREKLLKWEEECNSNEVVIAELAKQLNVFVQLIFFQDKDNFVVNEYEKDKQHKIILLIKPGHYNIGYFKPESENKNNNQDEQIKKSNQNQEQVVIEIHKSDNNEIDGQTIQQSIIGDVESVSENKNNNQDEQSNPRNQNQEQVVIDIPQQVINQPNSKIDGLSLLQNIINETSQQRQVLDEYKYYIRRFQDKSDLKKNYGLTLKASSKLYQYCNAFREVRGDGNCFYTAFGYQFLCILLFEYTFDQFQEFIDKIRKSDLPMKIFVTDKDLKIDDKYLEKQLLEEFLNRLTKLKQIDDITQRQEQFNTQFAAYEKQSEEIDGCLYGLSTIFFRNYSNYIVELSINKDAVFDREKLLKWEEECNSNEVVIAELAKQLNVFVQLIFFKDLDNFVVNEYEKDKQHKIILLIKPGHYNIGYFIPQNEK
ncbi:unnamed protein product [Paramecium primaurelia]|uniref:OTU domain-containing protein n=1 Tax=Paramecium primaurelia TaxID=5886 RepID=A0A8S1PXY7_PARPR|nr:unnamed protein product [Paramecium primaurelia]